ncbi:hypothetical protein MAM1_0051c03364 [Mucor ambiguus]|uniref:F-box domain-containing protein n=1 Tax=Mucor ambiguus TaxID=91626 RepID=A0A0C9MPE6_9FUNG|nr:hypothetical protein MAM1_0051c03364 [Mucor ambiguus]
MYQSNQITQLPVEITREIFTHLLLQHVHPPSVATSSTSQCRFISAKSGALYPNHATSRYFRYGEDGTCVCWQLDLLSVAMVCKSWYLIGLEFMQSASASTAATGKSAKFPSNQAPWLPLVNHPSYSRSYPFRSRLVKLLKESRMANLAFQQQVRHLVIDFASFDTMRREKSKSTNMMIKKRERLDIICDAGFANLVSCSSSGATSTPYDTLVDNSKNNSILNACNALKQTLIQQRRNNCIKRLDFIGFNPIQRCPCCAGKEWDQYLKPLVSCLSSVETLVLKDVLPSVDVFRALSSSRLDRIVFYKSMVTIPLFKKVKSASTSSTKFITSVSLIPENIWRQIKHIEIYEDIDDVTTWRSRRYLAELVNAVHDLESLVLQFDTKEANERSLLMINNSKMGTHDMSSNACGNTSMPNCDSPLYDLSMKCKTTLKQMTLVNVPTF